MEKTSNKRRKLVDDDENLNGSADKKEPSMVEEAPYVIVVHGPPKLVVGNSDFKHDLGFVFVLGWEIFVDKVSNKALYEEKS
ncbi:hypothetical protein MKW98_021327 [Papaver atlanticum]|uniref:Uncharacterized protein n=1 Tax=Papaver atlanticum TaxID=357466 RepID=A0AAD4SRH0_9MAGN|nr:hypothetical protein MKW98_021327 [Papaver atlanticum]